MEYVIYFIITIGILVFVHEFGHFSRQLNLPVCVPIFSQSVSVKDYSAGIK